MATNMNNEVFNLISLERNENENLMKYCYTLVRMAKI